MTTIEKMGIEASIRQILPKMVEAGELAKKLQGIITAGHGAGVMVKENQHRFGSVLTDADILVETVIGSFLFTTFTDATFFGEEADKDRISAYFPTTARFQITLDPVNGTLFYRDGLTIWDMILTIRENGRFVGAVDYLPWKKTFYIGIEGLGAFTTTVDDIEHGHAWLPLIITTTSRTILTQRSSGVEVEKIERAGFTVVRLEEEYQPSPRWTLATKSILTGEVAGYVKPAGHFIDWGALAWIASQAGGAWSGPEFDLVTGRGNVIAANSTKVYQKLSDALK